ncbi:MAG: chaperone modulator CbpM [Thermodesulfobacteriota bacterium]
MAQEYYYRHEILEIFDCDDQFLSRLEDEDLVHAVEIPSGRDRVFMADQMERIRIIHNLMTDLDVNLAGCEVILEMRENMMRMQEQFDTILAELSEQLKRRRP